MPRGPERRRIALAMSHPPTFSEAVDLIEELSFEDQVALIEMFRKRIAEAHRRRFIEEVLVAEKELRDGKGKAVTVDELMAEIDG